MKVLLIRPPSPLPNVFGAKYSYLDVGTYPPLGLMYLAGYLERHSHHKVTILDMEAEKLNIGALKKRFEYLNPQFIGIHVNSLLLKFAYEVAREIRSISRDVHITLGGPHIGIFPQESLSLPEIDSIVIGEGEETLLELLKCLEEKGNLPSIKGLGYKKNGLQQINDMRPLIKDLDKLPFPARHFTNYKAYNSFIGKRKTVTIILTSRGCPYRCNFCYNQYEGIYRRRSVDNVIEEIKICVFMDIHKFMIFDELFVSDPKWVIDFCNSIVKNRLKIIFDIRTRIDTVNEEVLYKLKKAGCVRIKTGVESGAQEILNKMNKKLNIESVSRSFKLIKKAGIGSYATFMIGYPGETIEQIEKTFNYAKELDPDFALILITKLAPGSVIYSEALRNKILKHDYWKSAAENPVFDITCPLASDRFSEYELENMVKKFYSEFYFRPKYIFRMLSNISSFYELKNMIKAGYSLFINTHIK